MKKSIIKDLVYRIEGYGDTPEYEIEKAVLLDGNRIEIVVRRNQEQAETQGAENEGDK